MTKFTEFFARKTSHTFAAFALAFGVLLPFLFAPPAQATTFNDWSVSGPANKQGSCVQFSYTRGYVSFDYPVNDTITAVSFGVTVDNSIVNKIGWDGEVIDDYWIEVSAVDGSTAVSGTSIIGNQKHTAEGKTVNLTYSGYVTGVHVVVSGIDKGFWGGWYGPIMCNPHLDITAVPAPVASPSETPTVVVSETATPTVSESPTASVSPSPSESATSVSPAPSPTPSESATVSSPSPSPSPSESASVSASPSPSVSDRNTPETSTVVVVPDTSTVSDTSTATSVPSPSPSPTPSPEPTPSPTPSPSPAPAPAPEPVPAPKPEPVAVPTPTPTPSPKPEPTPEPTPVPTPEPTPEPTPITEDAFVDTEVKEPDPVLIPEPVVTPEPTQEPTPVPSVEPTPQPEQSQPPVDQTEQTDPEPVVQPSPAPSPIVVPTPEPTKAPEVVILSEDTNLEELAPDTPVELENGVVLTAEVVIALQLLENPTELLSEIFTDPGQVLTALSNIGADMSPEVREKSKKVVVSAIIAGGIATQAASAAAVSTYRRKP